MCPYFKCSDSVFLSFEITTHAFRQQQKSTLNVKYTHQYFENFSCNTFPFNLFKNLFYDNFLN
jgi:hypothetical protein